MTDPDLSDDPLQIGKDVLQQSFDADELNSSSFSQAAFVQISNLSTCLKTLDVQSPEISRLSLFDIEEIVKHVNLVVASLRSRAPLTPDIGPGNTVVEGYRLAVLGLLAVQNSSAAARSALQRENLDLKDQIAQYVPRDPTALLNYIRSEFSISYTDPNLIAKELKRKRDAEKRHASTDLTTPGSPASPRSTRLSRAQAKIEALTERVRSLEESGRSRDLELEHLKSTTRTVSTIDFGVEPLERVKYNDALSELGSEVTRLTAELAEEARQKAQLMTLVQRQSTALAYAERHAVSPSTPVRAAPADSIDSVLKAGLDRAFPRGELSIAAADVFAGRGSPAEKAGRLFELIRSRGEKVASHLAQSRESLTVYLGNLLRFLDQLANSRELQSWVLDAPVEEDFRPRLLSQLTRVEEFLHRQGISLATVPQGDGLPGLADLVLGRLKEQKPDAQDLQAVIEVLAEVLDVSRKFALNLRKQNDALIANRLELQRELERQEDAGEDVMGQIADATASLKERLQLYKSKSKAQAALLQNVTDALEAGDSTEARRLLSGDFSEPRVQSEPRVHSETARVERPPPVSVPGDVRETAAALDAALAQISELSRAADAQAADLARAVEERADLVRQLAERDRVLADTRAARQKLVLAHAEVKRLADFQREKIRRDHDEHQAAIVELERRHKAELLQRVEKLEEERHAQEVRAVEDISAIQARAKTRIRTLKRRLEAQTQKTASAEQSIEALSGELQQKLTESNQSEHSAQQELQRAEAQVKELRADLTTARIDLKMLQVKLDAAEDRVARERSLAESRAQTAELTRAEAHEQALAEQRAEAERRIQEFVDAVAEPLAEFVAGEANEEAVIAAAAAAREAIENGRTAVGKLSHADSELAAVRSVLGLTPERPIVPVVTQLTAKGNWEDWAKRMHTLATGNFALVQTPEQVQAALEEVLLMAQRQSGIARKLEMLRFEKQLLVSGKVLMRRGIQKPNFSGLVLATLALKRLVRLSGRAN